MQQLAFGPSMFRLSEVCATMGNFHHIKSLDNAASITWTFLQLMKEATLVYRIHQQALQ
jgi:hypothetical protein